LAELAKLPFCHRATLAPLNRQEIGALLAQEVGGPLASALASFVHQRTEGNPLFVVEAMRLLHRVGSADHAINVLEQGLPGAVGVLIGAGVTALPEPCRDLLTTAALLGLETPLPPLCRAAGLDEDQALKTLVPALNRGLVETSAPDRLRFTHELVQRAVIARLLPAERRRLHQRCGEALEELSEEGHPTEVARLAHHFAQAGSEARTKAVRYLKEAGLTAFAAHAYESALEDFQQARVLHSAQDREGAELKLLEARALVVLEKQREAAALIQEAFEILFRFGENTRAVDALLFPYSYIGRDPHITLGPARERALDLVPAESVKAGRLLAFLAMNYKFESYHRAIDVLERSLKIARAHGDRSLELTAIHCRSHVHHHCLHHARCVEDARTGWKLAHELGDLPTELQLGGLLATRLIASGDRRQSERVLELLRPTVDRLGPDYWTLFYWEARAFSAVTSGAWDELRAVVEQTPFRGIDRMEQQAVAATTTQDQSEWLARYIASSTHIRERSCDTAAELPNMVLTLASHSFLSACPSHLDQVRAWGREALARRQSAPLDRFRARLALCLEALMRGDRDALDAAFGGELVECGRRLCWSALVVDRCRGLFAGALGRVEDARAYYEAALRYCDEGGFRPELGRTCLDYARLLLSRDAPERARTLVARGRQIAGELGMPRLQHGLDELARQLDTSSPRESLTAREREVLTLVAAGKSNREIGAELFISYHTVVNHLRHMYQKTGAHSRVDLVRYALRKGYGTHEAQ
jgi:DNA-binding CsgD family transcriptional regulator